MKKIVLLLALLMGGTTLFAQDLIVKKELEHNVVDLQAKLHPRYDINDDACAVIRVAIPSNQVTFDGWVIGEVERNKSGEYFVYMAHGSKYLKIAVEGCLPMTYEFPFKVESNNTYHLRLQLPDEERTRAIIMPNFTIGKSQTAYGLMVGFVKRSGAYLRAKSDFSFITTDAVCDIDGTINGQMPWYSGKSQKKRWAVTAGYVQRVAKPFYLFAGVGYGQRILAWERLDGSFVEYQDASYKGVEAEIGAMLRFGIVGVSVGVQTNSFKYMETNIGVGVMF